MTWVSLRSGNARPTVNVAANDHEQLIVAWPKRTTFERHGGILAVGAPGAVARAAPEAFHDIGKLFLHINQISENSRVDGDIIANRIGCNPVGRAYCHRYAVHVARDRDRPGGQLRHSFRQQTDYE